MSKASARSATRKGKPSDTKAKRPAGAVHGELRSDDDLPVVGLGALAGGLAALEAFFGSVPDRSGMAYVVIQHLDTARESLMPELLQRATSMMVFQVKERMKVEPDRVYVLPPNRELSIQHGMFHLHKPGVSHGFEPMRFEHELREREARYRAVIETSADGFLAMDRKGCLLEANEAYARQSGYACEALIGMNLADLEAKESAEEMAAHIEKVVAAGHDRFESVHRRQDGSLWPVAITASHWAELDRFFVFVTDITERKRMEAKFIEVKRTMDGLQKQQVAVHTAVAIAHEVNQPLQAVTTYGELSLSILDAEIEKMDMLRKTVKGSTQQAIRAGKAIAQILEMLSGSQAEAEAFDLNEEVHRIVDLAKSEHGLRLRTVLHLAKKPCVVLANRLHLQQVLLNLIRNSVEAMEEAGVVSPVVTVSVRAKSGEGMAQMKIRDKGPGFKAEDAEHLFKPFFTGKGGGIGMGLAISRSLIEANDGQLWIDPAQTPGATVHLTLPFASAD